MISDHCALLIFLAVSLSSKRRFHFESFWPKQESYLQAIQDAWACPSTITDPLRRLDCLLRNTAKGLQSWGQKRVGNIKMQLLVAKEVIYQLDKAQDAWLLTPAESWLRKSLKVKCLGLAFLERTMARQRARINWHSFLAKSAYSAFFGSIQSASHKQIWKAWAPLKCKFFVWLALQNRCWTTDHLQRRGLANHDSCKFCSLVQESVEHLFRGCLWVRHFWTHILRKLGLGCATPRHDSCLCDWWTRVRKHVPKEHRRGLDSIVILAIWTIWKEWNDCVFENKFMDLPGVVAKLWQELGVCQ